MLLAENVLAKFC